MNGFGGFWAKVDENEWLLSKSKIREKRSREVATKAQRHEEREEFLATNERELTRINKREEEFRIQNAEEKKKKKYNRREFNHEETKSTKKRRK